MRTFRLLQDRIDAVEEIVSSPSDKLVALRQALKKLPDLAKGLCRIQYGKVTFLALSSLINRFKHSCSVLPKNLPSCCLR